MEKFGSFGKNLKRIVSVVGARPQFIKMAPLQKELKKIQEIQEITMHTGQHYDHEMSDVFFEELGISKPDFNLQINGISHGAMTGRMLEQLELQFQKIAPSLVLVFGDTNSTLAGALAAKKCKIPVAHIESGLRSFNQWMPEEINRKLVDHISNLLFVSSEIGLQNLIAEGIKGSDQKIVQVGDLMYDSIELFKDQAVNGSKILEKLSLHKNQFLLASVHREENTDNLTRLSEIIRFLNKLNEKIPVVFPIHPRTLSKIKDLNLNLEMICIKPVGYLDSIALMSNAKSIVTDSGGMQKESFFLKKFSFILRDRTEWVELEQLGVATLLRGTLEDHISKIFETDSKSFPSLKSPYGEPNVSSKIASEIQNFLKSNE